MTRIQKLFCLVLSLAMLAGLAGYLPLFFWIAPGYEKDILRIAGMLPLMTYCRTRDAREPLQEDPWTAQAILESDQEYLTAKVTRENHQEIRQEEEEQEAAPEETPRETEAPETPRKASAQPAQAVQITREQLEDYEYLMDHFFILDGSTSTDSGQINAAALLDRDMSLPADQESPQILIYHSHSQEEYADSVTGDSSTTVVAVGEVLAAELRDTYGYGVIHVTDAFDMANGELDRSGAYDYAREKVEQVLAENPSVEVVIDLHRDGVPSDRRLVTEIDGKPAAQVMFFNGLSYSAKNGVIDYLPNPYIAENLAFSFQMELEAQQYFPGLCRGIYLSSLRYNLHLKPRAVLLEVGAQTNTLEEAENAMGPCAWVLDRVLRGS